MVGFTTVTTIVFVGRGALTTFTVIKVTYQVYSKGRALCNMLGLRRITRLTYSRKPVVVLITKDVEDDFVMVDK